MKIFGSLKELVAAVFRKDSYEITLRPNQSITYTAARDVQLPPVNADVVLVSTTGGQTLTGKTIDGDDNTIQDVSLGSLKTVLADADKAVVRDATGAVTSAKIANANVAAAAAIDYTKLNLSGAITNNDISASAGIVDSKLATLVTPGKVNNSATSATALNTNFAIVQRDSTGSFAAGTVTATSFSGPLTNSAISLATSVSYDATTAAANTTVTPAADKPIVVLNTLTSATINALANPAPGKQVVLINNALGDLTINDDNGSPSTSGIRTGTNSAFTFKSNAAITLTYSSTLSRWVMTGGAGGGSGAAVVQSATGVAAGYAVGSPVYYNSGSVIQSSADVASTAEVVGLVQAETSAGSYKIVTYGVVDSIPAGTFDTASFPSLGTTVFLSPTTGKLTVTEPATIGQVSVPLGVYIATGTIYVAPKRGAVVGGTNARTQLNLPSNATTQIFNAASPSLYQAGELTGWVQLGTSQKFYFRAPFAQNGAATDWNISPSYVGDTPPSGFSITMNSSGVINAVCPTFSGTGLINYALNAPAVGATFPLAVDAASITTGTIAAARLPSFAPTQTKYLSGSGTYTVPANVKWLKVRMVGGGGGGAGGTSAGANTAGGVGGNTTFGTNTANGGGGGGVGGVGSSYIPGAGGTATLGSGLIGFTLAGATGCSGHYTRSTSMDTISGAGGNSVFGGGGGNGAPGNVGTAGVANTGGGGGGGNANTSYTGASGGAGGGAGGFVEAIIAAPLSTYSYAVGAGGTAGPAGTNGQAGGAGGSGIIIIDEYYY